MNTIPNFAHNKRRARILVPHVNNISKILVLWSTISPLTHLHGKRMERSYCLSYLTLKKYKKAMNAFTETCAFVLCLFYTPHIHTFFTGESYNGREGTYQHLIHTIMNLKCNENVDSDVSALAEV